MADCTHKRDDHYPIAQNCTMGAYLHCVGLIKPVGVSQVLHACKVCVGINAVFTASGWAWHCRLMRICFTCGANDWDQDVVIGVCVPCDL